MKRKEGVNQNSASASSTLAGSGKAANNIREVRSDTAEPKGGEAKVRRREETWQVSNRNAVAEGKHTVTDMMKMKPKGRSPEPEAPPAPAGSGAGGEGEQDEELPPYEEEEVPPPYEEAQPSPAVVLVSSSTMKMAILPTFQAEFKNPSNNNVCMGRALADSGGQTSLITQELAKKLNLTTTESDMKLTYAEGKVSEEPLAETKVTMISPLDPTKQEDITVYVVPTIAKRLQGFKGDPFKTYPSIKERNRPLADEFTRNGKVKVDVLIGTNNYWKLGLTAPIKPKEQRQQGLEVPRLRLRAYNERRRQTRGRFKVKSHVHDGQSYGSEDTPKSADAEENSKIRPR